MSLQSFEKYANCVIRHYQLPIRFAWVKSDQFMDYTAKLRGLGYFSPPDSAIGILKELYHADERKAKMVFLHEVAHAVRFYKYGKERTEDDIHDELFEGISAEVGGDILEEQDYVLAKKPWRAFCPVCGSRWQVEHRESNVLCPACLRDYRFETPMVFRRMKNPTIFEGEKGVVPVGRSTDSGQGGWFRDYQRHSEAARKGADKRRLGTISALKRRNHG